MATAKKLPSGQWRTLVYSHTENGKRKYESFTADTKKKSEYMAAEFALNKEKKERPKNMTLRETIDKYINSSDGVLSPTTIQGYKKIKKNSFQDIMELRLDKITTIILQESVNTESKRKSKRNSETISPKTVINSYGLLTAVLNKYYPDLDCSVRLPAKENKIKELPEPEVILNVIKGTQIELPVLLAIWLSFSMSEVRGLTKNSISNDGIYITIKDVVVDVDGVATRKKQAKTLTRNRMHKIPGYIKKLIEDIPDNQNELVTLSGHAIYCRFTRLLKKNGIQHMTFHDLRHMNASIMHLLQIPDKYAMERGGWKTDKVMKKVYTHTFSEPRKEADQLIDSYFNSKMQHEMQHK